MTGQPVEAYIDELLKEYDSYDISSLKTLYIGGGTPSVLPADQLEKLLTHLTKSLI